MQLARTFASSCNVLKSALSISAYDIRKWLQNPVDGAKLGDLR